MIKKHYLLPILVTIFIDGFGLGMIFPLVTPLILETNLYFHLNLPELKLRETILAIVFSLYPLGMLIGTPIISFLSDKVGRKKILFLSLLGNAIGFFTSGLSILSGNVLLLFIGRFISGIFAGNIPVAQATIADNAENEQEKASLFGYVSLLYGLGFTVGPFLGILVGGIIKNSEHFQFAFYILAIICTLNAIFLKKYFKDSIPSKVIKWGTILEVFKNLFVPFKQKKVCQISFVFFLFIFGQFSFFQYLPIFIVKNNTHQPNDLAYFMGYYALMFSISLIFILPILLRKLAIRKLLFCSIITLPFTTFAFYFFGKTSLKWLIIIPITMAFAFIYVSIVTTLSNVTSKEHQGQIMGVTSALTAIAWGISPLLTNLLKHSNIVNPLLYCFLIFCCLLIVAFRYIKEV